MQIQPQITVKNRTTGERRVYRLDQDQILIGRDISNYVVLEGKSISRKHAEVLCEKDQHFIRDLKSNNGTSLNEKKLPSQEKTLLRSGDTILIDDFELNFHIPKPGEAEDIYEVTDSDLLEIKMVKKLLKAMDKESAPSFQVMDGSSAGQRSVLEGKNQDILIGRDAACEFQIDSDVISRKHARVVKRLDTLVLHDLKSKNGTYVNREKISEKRLKDGDIIHLGTLTLLFRNPQDLGFDLKPPVVKKEEVSEQPPPAPEAPPSAEEPAASGETRASRRRENAPPPARESSISKSIGESETEDKTPGFSLGPLEILALLVGLAVLLGSVWGIAKILK